MNVSPHELEGLRIWAMIWGQNVVEFAELQKAEMLRFFVFSEYVDKGYLKRGHTKGKSVSSFILTDKALELVRETA
jgi:hypothetical protein